MPKTVERIPYCATTTTTRDDALAEFIRAKIEGNLSEVPSIAEATTKELAKGDEPIKTTHQLIGKFLALSPDEPDGVEHCNRFKYWLQDKNVANHLLNNIVEAIAEKTECLIPGEW
ncbi:conserved unknown protein [Ectocarpus siliculosus]|uniref:Uncharacterized protein n=1 Tax=Ectocarpus siliculosus TaxID=2880 RepID=D7FY53_ECTSI|nr:conserved unknown protein [Ectocarpus siliculosus]|eukprot:CBJ26492.1 conserved unknown protein [Ectocarpus siliculosus]